MDVYSLTATGKYHPLNCEDRIFYDYVGSKYLVAAVMDGCSSGKESHFAATLYAKSVQKSCLKLSSSENITSKSIADQQSKEKIGLFILKQLFEDVGQVKETLALSTLELLSTLILLIYDTNDNSGWINVSGDGFVVCNGKMTEIDQNNTPDYMAYHLQSNFEQWQNDHTLSLNFDDIHDISISTDGISKLKKNPRKPGIDIDPMKLFLTKTPGGIPEKSMYNTYAQLVDDEKYIAHDDIGIIRLILSAGKPSNI